MNSIQRAILQRRIRDNLRTWVESRGADTAVCWEASSILTNIIVDHDATSGLIDCPTWGTRFNVSTLAMVEDPKS